ncbi:hypothetical protein [Hymenobacter lucidus]|uniref:HEAT repeat domain-containing protein n=1 Tax=Hymenobacter lucidus TaxID=2880930 RepID=A0ABS8AU29_9BACT|nr:hypothetical protein [Hymenobacter lucidus]MCB2409083.1 hypothetical protein [Hymenobacter lucidus]
MNKQAQFDRLQEAVFSGSWNEVCSACNRLYHFGGGFNKTIQRKCRRFLLGLLNQENAQIRNAAALTFRHNRANWAVCPLLSALKKPANLRSRGTLAYALQTLNCSRHLRALFELLFGAAGNNWEVQMHILTILDDQSFIITQTDMQSIQQQWEDLKPSWNRLNNITAANRSERSLDETLIQGFVDEYATASSPSPTPTRTM